jgi:hypothetical protein
MGTHAITMFELDRLFMQIHGDTKKYKSTHNRVIEGILGHSGRGAEYQAKTSDASRVEGKSPLRRRNRVGVLGAGTGEKGQSGSENGPEEMVFSLGNLGGVGGQGGSDVKPAGGNMLSGLISAHKKESESAQNGDESAKKLRRREKR